jgi:hypothetical protein
MYVPILSLLLLGWRRGRYDFHPAAWTSFYIGIVPLRILAVIPIRLLHPFRGRLHDVFLGLRLLLDNNRRGCIVRIIRRIRVVRIVRIIRTEQPRS